MSFSLLNASDQFEKKNIEIVIIMRIPHLTAVLTVRPLNYVQGAIKNFRQKLIRFTSSDMAVFIT